MIELLGVIAAVALPFWNIPLIITITQRQSSKDISLTWTFGVLGCLVLMLPAALRSPDVIFKIFGIVNLLLFAVVALQVVRYR